MERLDLSNNQLSGEIPPEVGDLSKLTHLSLPGNQLSGQIPPELDKLTRLQFLDLEENQLSGCMSDFLREMGGTGLPVCAIDSEYPNAREALIAVYNALGKPDVLENWLSHEPIADWEGVTTDSKGRVVNLKLGGSRLSGEIPPELGSLPDLTHLDLSENQLNGAIPPELGGLSNLGWLNLSYNQLSGEIPPELGGLSNLQMLYLNKNQLSGEIPPELGGLSNLEYPVPRQKSVVGGDTAGAGRPVQPGIIGSRLQ